MIFPKEVTDNVFLLQLGKLREKIIANTNRSIMVTGAERGHGTSTIAANIAYDLSKNSNCPTLLILDSKKSLADGRDIFSVDADLEEAIELSPRDNLSFACTQWKDTKKTQIRNEALDKTFESLKKSYSHIIIDAPCVRHCPEILGILPAIDLTVLLVRANSIRWQVLNKTKQIIEEAKPKKLGVIINRKKYYIPGFLYNRL